MSGRFEVKDTDAHYLESLPELASYIDEPWRSRFEASPEQMFPSISQDNYLFGRIQRDDVGYLDGKMTPDDIPAAMDHVGVDSAIILSQLMLAFDRLNSDDERPIVLANGYTDYMLNQVVDPGKGIYTMLPIPYQEPEEAVDLIDRAGGENGIVGACFVTAGAEPPFGNRKYDIIYEAAQSADLPVVFHGGGGGLDSFSRKGYERPIESHTLGFLWNNMAQLVSIVTRGIPEKFPDLDIVFQESGILWVASLMSRLDEEYLKRQSEAPLLERLPSEYMKDFYYGTQPMETPSNGNYLRESIEMIGGAGSLIYASDYPHWDYDPPNTITDLPVFSDEEKKQILSANAKEVFGI